MEFPGDAHSKESPANAGEARDGFDSWVGKTPWKRKQQPTPAFLPGKSHGQRRLAGSSPWGYKESDTTEHTYWFPFIRKKEQKHRQTLDR